MSSFVLSLCLIVSVLSIPLQEAISTELQEVIQNSTELQEVIQKETCCSCCGPVGKWINNAASTVNHHVVQPVASEANKVIDHVDHAANAVVKETVTLSNGVANVAVEFGNNVGHEFEKAVHAVGHELNKVKNAIEAILAQFGCSISSDTLFNVVKNLGSMSSNLFSTLKDATYYNGLKSSWGALADSTCRTVWDTVYSTNPMIALVIEFLNTLHTSCPALAGGGNPAISLGIGIAAGADSLYSAELSAEIGLAVDRHGKKYCYIGGCMSVGITLPPIPSVGTDTGLHLSVWTDPGNIAGSSNTLGLSGTVGAFGLEISPSIDYIYGEGKIEKFLGFSCSGTIGAVSEPVTASIGFSAASCLTPVYLQYKPAPVWHWGARWGLFGFGFLSLTSNASLISVTSNDTTNYDTTEACAHQGEQCICNGDVYYGAGEDYVVRRTDDHLHCSADMFQKEGQPEVLSGSHKICVCVGTDYDLGRRCADEGDTCECTGGVTYGARGFYDSTIVDGSIVCNNDNFGDPVPGITKHCYCNENDSK